MTSATSHGLDAFGRDNPCLAYNAGDLFTHHALAGNIALAAAVYEHSAGRLVLLNPQDLEPDLTGSQHPEKTVRDSDFWSLVSADLVIGNFEGLEIDSGTVCEATVAAMVGMPRVLLRSDLRRPIAPAPLGEPRIRTDDDIDSAQQNEFDAGWNLMMKHYTRTVVVEQATLLRYQEFLAATPAAADDYAGQFHRAQQAIQRVQDELAQAVVTAVDRVLRTPSTVPTTDEGLTAFRRMFLATGAEYDQAKVAALVAHKAERGVL